jgi:DNA-binding MarR family transcriptional regulator
MAETPGQAGLLDQRELVVWRRLLRVHAALTRSLDAELRAAHGLTLSDYDVLVQLAEAPARHLRMSELAQRVLLTRSGITRLVDGLVAQGLVARTSCPDDGRVSHAELTPRGLELLRAASRTHLAGVRRGFVDRLRGPELDELGALLGRLEAAGAEDGDCAA